MEVRRSERAAALRPRAVDDGDPISAESVDGEVGNLADAVADHQPVALDRPAAADLDLRSIGIGVAIESLLRRSLYANARHQQRRQRRGDADRLPWCARRLGDAEGEGARRDLAATG